MGNVRIQLSHSPRDVHPRVVLAKARTRPHHQPQEFVVTPSWGFHPSSAIDSGGNGSRVKPGTTVVFVFLIQLSNSDEGASPRSRGVKRPSFANFPPSFISRGRRESRVRAAPAVSCANCARKCAHEHTGEAEAIRLSLRDGFTAYFVLSPVTGFLATVIVAKRILPQNLTPAPGRQDHTTSPSA